MSRLDLTERLSLICFILSGPYFFVFNYFGFHLAGNFILLVLFCFLIPIPLNRLGFANIAKFVFIFVATGVLFFYSLILGKSSGAYLVFISTISLPIILFNDKDVIKIILGSLIPISAAYFLEIVDYQFIFQQSVLNGISEKIIHGFAMSTAFLFALFSSLFFYLSHRQASQKLIELNTTLIKANTELKTTYQALKESKITTDKLQEQAAYANLTMGIAHEIRNPFAILQSSMELLLAKRDNKELAEELSQRIKRGMDRILKIIQVMLKYGGAAAKEKEELDLNALLEDYLLTAKSSFDRTGIQFEMSLGEIPAVFGDPTAIYQIIGNLIQNAKEAISQANRENGRIHLSTLVQIKQRDDSEEAGVELSISDNGIGISAEAREKIYNAFFSTKYGNHGLGLSVILNLVKDHNGLIEVDSEDGIGTTFRVWIPVYRSESA